MPLPLTPQDRETRPSGLVVPIYPTLPAGWWVDPWGFYRYYPAGSRDFSPKPGESCRRLQEMGVLLCTCWQVDDGERVLHLWACDCPVHPIYVRICDTYIDDARDDYEETERPAPYTRWRGLPILPPYHYPTRADLFFGLQGLW